MSIDSPMNVDVALKIFFKKDFNMVKKKILKPRSHVLKISYGLDWIVILNQLFK